MSSHLFARWGNIELGCIRHNSKVVDLDAIDSNSDSEDVEIRAYDPTEEGKASRRKAAAEPIGTTDSEYWSWRQTLQHNDDFELLIVLLNQLII